ncbi:hypothetical protein MLD38_033208 [Melastoma candidum]|uniref:Uncharacterized protein n=1 Tax=Melastoma candidum TaxID=119954 RepID=A0ACB9M8M3_9MYRT|nr:hypothetical protein MLD38_033208 [Melastoma candidum]
MQGGQMLVEDSAKLSSVLLSTGPGPVQSLTKIIATLGPKSRSVEVVEACLMAGMSIARFDFSSMDADYHQETLDNLKTAMRNSRKLCAIMMDTTGPELRVTNESGKPVELKADDIVTVTSDTSKKLSSKVVPVDSPDLAKMVKKGDTIFLSQHLFTGHETTSVWLEVSEIKDDNVICQAKNGATLAGSMFTIYAPNVQSNMPALTENDKQLISEWGTRNNVNFISFSYTRRVDDVRELRAFLKSQNLQDTQIYAKVETVEGLRHFNEILEEADGIIFGRGNLGIDLPPEKVFLFQKYVIKRCNMVGKPVVVTRVVDSMTGNLRPTRAEATDVANAVLDGADSIMLGAETLIGLYPVEAIKTVQRICAEAENVYNHPLHFKKVSKHAGEPTSDAESVASSAVGTAIKVKASTIVVFTSSGRAARLIAKYRPPMPVVALVIPRLQANSIRWTFTGSQQARQLLGVRGVHPILAGPEIATSSEESGLKLAINHCKSMGLHQPGDRIVVFQKIGDSAVAKIVELQRLRYLY